MGRSERDQFKRALTKLSELTDEEENDEYYARNQRVADAEDNLTWAENLWLRATFRPRERQEGQ